jgi:hypothetical protein
MDNKVELLFNNVVKPWVAIDFKNTLSLEENYLYLKIENLFTIKILKNDFGSYRNKALLIFEERRQYLNNQSKTVTVKRGLCQREIFSKLLFNFKRYANNYFRALDLIRSQKN